MKKFILMTILSLCFGDYSYAIRENKIIRVGYVNYAKLIEKVDKDGSIQKQVDQVRNNYQDKIESLNKDIESLQEKVGSNPSTDNINEDVSLLENKNLELALLKIKATQDIEKTTNNALSKINEKIKPTIENIAKKQNFDIIIDSSLILLAVPGLDITNFVLASL